MSGDLQEESIRCLISGKERFEVYPGTSPERSMIFSPSPRGKLGSRYSSGGLRTVTKVICSFLPNTENVVSAFHFNTPHSLFYSLPQFVSESSFGQNNRDTRTPSSRLSDIPRNCSCKEMVEYGRSRKSGFVPEDKQGLMRDLSVVENMCEKGRCCVLWHD